MAESAATISADEVGRQSDLETTAEWLFISLLTGMALVVLRFLIAFVNSGLNGNGWRVTGQGFTSLLWALAWFAAGFVFGFLFGIPKVLQSNVPPATQVPQGAAVGAPGGTQTPADKARDLPYQLRVNTNLEDISDWLTKVLVGATLSQLVKIPSIISGAAAYIAKGLGGSAYESFAAAIVLFFSTVGFLAGYVLTRMFFSRAFSRSDQGQDELASVVKGLKGTRTRIGDNGKIDNAVRATAEKSTAIKLSDSLSGAEIGALVQGALLTGNSSRAVQAASLALAKNSTDARAHLDYAVALYKAGAAPDGVLSELEKAAQLVTPDLDSKTKEDIYNSIVYLALYQAPPQGFEKAIQFGEAFVGSNTPSEPSIWINLACAYGQQYAYLKDHAASDIELKKPRDGALKAIKKAIELDVSTKERFRELASSDNDADDDLVELAKDDVEVRAILGL